MPRLYGRLTTRAGDGRRPVGRAVVDDDDFDRRIEGLDLVHHRADRVLFVPRRHDRDRAQPGQVPAPRVTVRECCLDHGT
jgi:hypothetical protein